MDVANSSTECINGTSQFIVDLSVGGVTCLIGAGSCLTAIVLILVAKGHKEFIYRLLLYMAVDGLLGSLTLITYVFESDYNVRYDILAATFMLLSYLIFTYSFLLCWLGLYLFSLAVFRVQLKKTKHEAIGLVTVLVTPLTFSWVFPWKKIIGFCISSNLLKLNLLFGIPVFSLVLLSCLFIGALLLMFCKNALDRQENTLQQQHRKAVRETIPLVVFMIAHITTIVMLIVLLACDYYYTEVKSVKKFVLQQILNLWPVVLVSLPILLLFQPHIRHKIKCRRSQRLINVNATSGYGTTVHQSHPSSYTHFSSPHEDSHLTLIDQTT